MTATYDLIASNVLSSSASSVSFSSLSGYRDLVFVVQATATQTNDDITMRLNGDTGSNYHRVQMSGNGSATASDTSSTTSWNFSNLWSLNGTTATLLVVSVLDASATDKHKAMLARWNLTAQGTGAIAGRYASTSAITSASFQATNSNFASGSSFYVYGISA